jgi:hypothetical protein
MNRFSSKLIAFSLLVMSCFALPSAVSLDSHEFVAARWHQRARTGQLHYRSTPAGRALPHTVVPTSVRGKQAPPRIVASGVVWM